jgi:deoxycytidylate deaminase
MVRVPAKRQNWTGIAAQAPIIFTPPIMPRKSTTTKDDYLGYYPEAELVFGICCPLGTDYRPVLDTLRNYLEQFGYAMHEVKLSSQFDDILLKLDLPKMKNTASPAEQMANKIEAGNKIRKITQKADILALVAAGAIASNRPEELQLEVTTRSRKSNTRATTAISHSLPQPRTAHVVVSLKRPEEVEALRRIYGAGFFLIGIASTEEERIRYLRDERGLDSSEIQPLIEKDAKEADSCGQRTRDTFSLSDVFLRDSKHKTELGRFLDLVFGSPTETPTVDERSMYAAYAASFSSGDLARQVGAAVVSARGDLLSTGWNDVPKFGGGLYSPEDKPYRDKDLGEDPNDFAKAQIADAIREALGPEWKSANRRRRLMDALRTAGFFDITEFQRAVHAEMEAILACTRNRQSTRKASLYVTTFPCHNCTKHIIDAGFDKVFFIEPYAKSKALKLHSDAITTEEKDIERIPFLPFIGVGPRRYLDLFSLGLGTGYKVERKENGRLKPWKRAIAVPRLQMQPRSYLDREELALHSLKKVISKKRNEQKAKTKNKTKIIISE